MRVTPANGSSSESHGKRSRCQSSNVENNLEKNESASLFLQEVIKRQFPPLSNDDMDLVHFADFQENSVMNSENVIKVCLSEVS